MQTVAKLLWKRGGQCCYTRKVSGHLPDQPSSTPLTFGARSFSAVRGGGRGRPGHGRVFSSTPELDPLDAVLSHSHPWAVTIQYVPRLCQVSPGEKNHPRWKLLSYIKRYFGDHPRLQRKPTGNITKNNMLWLGRRARSSEKRQQWTNSRITFRAPDGRLTSRICHQVQAFILELNEPRTSFMCI